MAHIQDRWERTVDGQRVRTGRYGKGKRWQARYRDPDGHERTHDFARKVDAERFLTAITADVLRGAYVDPQAGKVTFADFAERWLASQTFGDTTREATEHRLRHHAIPQLGGRELRAIRPSIIQSWIKGLTAELAPTYVRAICTNVARALNAAVDDSSSAHRSATRRAPSPCPTPSPSTSATPTPASPSAPTPTSSRRRSSAPARPSTASSARHRGPP